MILPGDKGRFTVVLNKSDDESKTKPLMDDTTAYKVVVGNPLSGVVNQLNTFLLHLKAENKITPKKEQLMGGKEKPMASFNGLPKIHKMDVPLHPLVVFNNTPVTS